MTKPIYSLIAVLVLTANTASAGCWNAEESGGRGPAVEICFEGRCEHTYMVVECAGAWGAIFSYANGMTVSVELEGSEEKRRVSMDDRVLTAQQLRRLTCRDLDADFGCRF